MSVKLGLMALLATQPMYGAQLRSEFERRTGGTWPLNVGQVYTTLGRLERDGLVEGSGAPDDEGRIAYRLTDAGRIVYSVYRGLLRPAFELRTVGVDGLGERSLGLFDSYTGYPETAGEIGGARVLVEMLVPGTLDRTEIVAVEDSPTATRTVIAGPLDGNSQRFSRLVLAPG